MTNYDWRVSARVIGQRNGWSRTLVDTPTFELRSNALYVGIWDRDAALAVVRDMFTGLMAPGDELYITISDVAGDEPVTTHCYMKE